MVLSSATYEEFVYERQLENFGRIGGDLSDFKPRLEKGMCHRWSDLNADKKKHSVIYKRA